MPLSTPQNTQYSPMAFFPCYKVVISLAIQLLVFTGSSSAQLSEDFYKYSCPNLTHIVQVRVEDEIDRDYGIGASLLRLHFHDCFVNGCDGSVLLDDTPNFVGEKSAPQNKNSLKGFDAIDKIKRNVETHCPGVVSCADILALAARASVVMYEGPTWHLPLGRRDARRASKTAATNVIPSPTMNVCELITRFQSLGFTIMDLVALSGAHTVGLARCTNFRDRLYNETGNIDPYYASVVKRVCSPPPGKGDGNNTAPLDIETPAFFDNHYFNDLVHKGGLLHSDQQLYFKGNKWTNGLVELYQQRQGIFFRDFANAMNKMSLLSPLITPDGEIRLNCRKVN